MLFLFYEFKSHYNGEPRRMYTETKESVEECTRYTFGTFSENQNDCYLFDSKDNKIGRDSISFPVIIGWEHFFKFPPKIANLEEKEGDWLTKWDVIENKHDFEAMLFGFDSSYSNKLKFVFEPKDDILDYAKKYVKDKEERREKEFEEKMSKGVHFKGDIVITDPCYFEYWEHEDMFTDHLERDTVYGDWSCTVYNTDTDKVLGEFCADAGYVGCYYLDEVLKAYPNFAKMNDWTRTIIKNFDGVVRMPTVTTNDDRYTYVEGIGNINFKSVQTGL